jgi:hypothetical protein
MWQTNELRTGRLDLYDDLVFIHFDANIDIPTDDKSNDYRLIVQYLDDNGHPYIVNNKTHAIWTIPGLSIPTYLIAALRQPIRCNNFNSSNATDAHTILAVQQTWRTEYDKLLNKKEETCPVVLKNIMVCDVSELIKYTYNSRKDYLSAEEQLKTVPQYEMLSLLDKSNNIIIAVCNTPATQCLEPYVSEAVYTGVTLDELERMKVRASLIAGGFLDESDENFLLVTYKRHKYARYPYNCIVRLEATNTGQDTIVNSLLDLAIRNLYP